MSKYRSLLRDTRGVSLVEYALILAALLLVVGAGYRYLGRSLKSSAECAANFDGNCAASGSAAAGHSAGHGGDGSGEAPSGRQSLESGGNALPDGNAAKARAERDQEAKEAHAAYEEQERASHMTYADKIYGKDMKLTDADFAMLSDDVYSDDATVITSWATGDHWRRVDPKDLPPGVDPSLLERGTFHGPGDGFRAALYVDDQGHHVLALKGTDPTSIRDWMTDAFEAAGITPGQYKDAVTLAKELKVAYGDDFAITGHSLGGGLATIASLTTGAPAVIFNPAGVSDSTMRDLHLDPTAASQWAKDGLVRSVEVQGEALGSLQESLSLPATPAARNILPDPHPLATWQKVIFGTTVHDIKSHMMGTVNDALHQHWGR